MMIDTHTHIYGPEFDTDRKQVVERALQAGVTSVVLPNVNLESLHQIKEMCADYPNFCHAAVGLHPEDVREDFRHQLRWVREELQNSEYVAVGEIGIDLYWDKTFLREQVCAFQQQVEWAIELDLPLIIHTRDSHAETLQALSPYKNRGLRGVFHCFTGDEKQANEIFEAVMKQHRNLPVQGDRNGQCSIIQAYQVLCEYVAEYEEPGKVFIRDGYGNILSSYLEGVLKRLELGFTRLELQKNFKAWGLLRTSDKAGHVYSYAIKTGSANDWFFSFKLPEESEAAA